MENERIEEMGKIATLANILYWQNEKDVVAGSKRVRKARSSAPHRCHARMA